MSVEFSQDQPVNHEAVVASYGPEMVHARDSLIDRLRVIKEQAKAADISGALHERMAVRVFDNGTTVVELGSISDEFSEARKQHRSDKALGAIALDIDGVSLPGSDFMVVTYDLDKAQENQDPSLPKVEQPKIKVEWGSLNGGETVSSSLALYEDGFVEASSDVTRTEYTFPPGSSDLVRAYGEPTVSQQVQVVPPMTHPAEVADIQNTAAQLENTAFRYGIAL